MTILVNCPNPRCNALNSFPDSAHGKIARCKVGWCRREWRLATANLPALRRESSLTPAPVATQHRIERLGGLVVANANSYAHHGHQLGGVVHHHAAPPPKPEELCQIEVICAVHDEPSSAIYTRPVGAKVFQFRKSEHGTGMIDRMLLQGEHLQRFSHGGGQVHYDRSITERSNSELEGFLCPWCGATSWFYCRSWGDYGGCGALVCHGLGRWRDSSHSEYIGQCRKSCGWTGKLVDGNPTIATRSARLTYPALAAPQHGTRQLQNRSGSTSIVVRRP